LQITTLKELPLRGWRRARAESGYVVAGATPIASDVGRSRAAHVRRILAARSGARWLGALVTRPREWLLVLPRY
jgi:hypothetical protein